MKIPTISVLMGVYYRSEDIALLRRSVKSIMNQSFSDFEFLICPAGSSKSALAYLREQARMDCRIRLVDGATDYSLPAKLNACFRISRAEFLARMDDDDLSSPERFEMQLNFLREHPEFAFVGSWASLVRCGEFNGVWEFPEKPEISDFFMTQPFLHPSLIFRRKALEAVGGYSEDPRCLLCEDYDLLLRLYAKGLTGYNLTEPLLVYTLPISAKGNRTLFYRFNETVTRWRRFRELGVLSQAWPYVFKPIAVGMLPERILRIAKSRRIRRNSQKE